MINDIISIVIPVYNESNNISNNIIKIINIIKKKCVNFEIIIIDDGSSDDSVIKITRLFEQYPCIKLIELTKNFGKEAAIYSGLKESKGNAAIVIDSDLQHPPELMLEMLSCWKNGNYLIDAVKRNRNDNSYLDKIFAKCFYYFYGKLSGLDISGYTDYKLLDRKIIDYYLSMPENFRFFRGMINWLGFENKKIFFDVVKLPGRKSRWSKLNLIKYAINNITSFTIIPLHIITFLGVITMIVGLSLGLVSLFQKIHGEAIVGFTTVNILLILIGGSVMTSLGIIGHYIGKIFVELKSRPIYIKKILKKEGESDSEMVIFNSYSSGMQRRGSDINKII
tara:strand:- start:2492 stop:3502 length:1011 start_codon:yes stop_codon:yes gene_type:complete